MSANKKEQKVDLDHIDLEKLSEKVSENPGVIPFAHSVGGAVIKPEDKGKIKSKAMAAMREQTNHQMNQIYEQMQTLVNQAQQLKKRVEISERIYQGQMNFDPVIGEVYFLYDKDGESDLLSMISPEEWGKQFPFKKFIAKVRLLSDHTWEVQM